MPATDLLRVRIANIVDEAIDIKSFELVAVSGLPLPAFSAGAHIDVHAGEHVVRQYSLCGAPADRGRYVIGVKLEAASRGGSQALHQRYRVGDELTISRPRNHFPLATDASHHLLLAAGIGATPMLGMVHHLVAQDASFALHYFARSPGHAAFQATLQALAPSSRVSLHLGLDVDAVEAALRSQLETFADGQHVYICGPRPFIAMAQRAAAQAWPAAHVHVEHFTADASKTGHDAGIFRVRLARTGGEFTVASDESIVSALAKHEIYLDTSCEAGVCGTCIVDVLEGVPDHRDEVLSAQDRASCRRIVPCVSRSKSDLLVLDF